MDQFDEYQNTYINSVALVSCAKSNEVTQNSNNSDTTVFCKIYMHNLHLYCNAYHCFPFFCTFQYLIHPTNVFHYYIIIIYKKDKLNLCFSVEYPIPKKIRYRKMQTRYYKQRTPKLHFLFSLVA